LIEKREIISKLKKMKENISTRKALDNQSKSIIELKRN
jgi:hypothetical protein